MNSPYQPDATKTMTITAASLLYTFVLLASLALFLSQPNHRIGGVAWNGLFQTFGSLAAFWYSLFVITQVFKRKIKWHFGVAAAILPAVAAGYCLYRSFPIMLSV